MQITVNDPAFHRAVRDRNQCFLDWAGTGKPALARDDIDHHFRTASSWGGPAILRVWHGTTHAFSAFDSHRHGHAEAQFGRVNYFTSCRDDAETNYAAEGPDLSNRLEARIERLTDEILDAPDAFGLAEDIEPDVAEDHARELARAELVGPEGRLIECYLRLDRPFVLGSGKALTIPGFEGADEVYSLACAEILGTDPDRSPRDEDEDAVMAAFDMLREAQFDRLCKAFGIAADRLGIETPGLPDRLLEEDLTTDNLEAAICRTGDLIYLQDDNGDLVCNDFFGKVVEALGFDSIVLLEADRRFRNMAMAPDTTHVQVFDSGRTKIKSVANAGTFDSGNPDIHA